MREREEPKGVSGSFGLAKATDQGREREAPRRWVEALCGQAAKGDDDFRSYECDLSIEVPGAESDLSRGWQAIAFAAASGGRSRKALGDTRQVEPVIE